MCPAPGSSTISTSGTSLRRYELTTPKLDRSLQPTQQAEVIAEVKDFTSNVTEVRLRFVRVPMEIRMQNIGGTTWRAQLTPKQLQTLAVGGQTMTYEANVIARNREGLIGVSKEPVEVAVSAPDLGQPTG